jgi:hypothetical protein
MSQTATANRIGAQPHAGEGYVAKMIEEQTASLALKSMGQDRDATFVGQWAPTLLILGLYNKLVKLQGSE